MGTLLGCIAVPKSEMYYKGNPWDVWSKWEHLSTIGQEHFMAVRLLELENEVCEEQCEQWIENIINKNIYANKERLRPY